MANINLTALNMFTAAKDWTADSVANLDGKDAIKKVGEYGGAEAGSPSFGASGFMQV